MISARKPAPLAIAAIVCLAALLRIAGLTFGPYHPDEHLVIHHALGFGTGDMNPHMFYYPTFFMYQLFGVFCGYYFAGHLLGRFAGAQDFLLHYVTDPSAVYWAARLLSAVYGIATVWLLIRIGSLFRSARTGLLAALILAVDFLHVRDSHFATVDVALTFYMLLAVYLLAQAVKTRRASQLIWGALCSGLALAVKYNAVALAVPALLAWIAAFRGRKDFWLLGAVAVLTAFAGFFLGSPFVILDFSNALPFIAHLKTINTSETFRMPFWFPAGMMAAAMGPVLFVAGLLGLLRPSGDRVRFALLLSAAAAYYVLIARIGQPHERYVLPLLPFWALGAALFADGLMGKFSAGSIFGRFVRMAVVAVLALSFSKSAYSDYLFLQTDTREQAKSWIEQNIPSGDAVAIDNSMLAPRLQPSARQLDEKIAALSQGGPLYQQKIAKLKALRDKKAPASYDLYYFSVAPGGETFTLDDPRIYHDPAALQAHAIEWIVTSEKAMRDQGALYRAIAGEWEVAARFSPWRPERVVKEGRAWTYLPIDGTLWDYNCPGPSIVVFRKKS